MFCFWSWIGKWYSELIPRIWEWECSSRESHLSSRMLPDGTKLFKHLAKISSLSPDIPRHHIRKLTQYCVVWLHFQITTTNESKTVWGFLAVVNIFSAFCMKFGVIYSDYLTLYGPKAVHSLSHWTCCWTLLLHSSLFVTIWSMASKHAEMIRSQNAVLVNHSNMNMSLNGTVDKNLTSTREDGRASHKWWGYLTWSHSKW